MADVDEQMNIGDIEENDADFEEMKEIVDSETGDDLENFLEEHKLSEHLSLFRDQQIDFETLMILTEPDLKSLGLPLGPFRKLIIALQKRKSELGDGDILDDSANKSSTKLKDDGDLPALSEEGNFRVIDESGDDSDAHSVKSEHAGGKKKDDSNAVEPDKNHPYKFDLLNFKLNDEFKEKVELQEPIPLDAKTLEMVIDERRLKIAIKALRKEKIIAVDTKHIGAYARKMTVMQISTQNVDYLIDFDKMNHLILLLTDIFTNANILKVFYDAKHEVKMLQKYYNLFTVNAYCVRSAVKELKYETSSLYGLINKYVSYFKPTYSECSQRPLRNDVKLNMRNETHYLLHVYLKTRNEAIEAGVLDNIVAIGTRICGYLHVPMKERKPNNLFPDFDKFNEAQKLAAEELCKWREDIAKNKKVDPNSIMRTQDIKELSLSLPIKKEEILGVASYNKIVRFNSTKLLAIMKTARKKYFNDPKDESKYELKAVVVKKFVDKMNRPVLPKVSPKPKPAGSSNAASPKPKPDLKRKNETFARPGPAKKGRFRTRKNFPTKRNSFDNNKAKSPKGSPFRSPGGGYRGGYQGNNMNAGKNIPSLLKYPSPQNIWEPAQNQNFNNSYGSGFKYY